VEESANALGLARATAYRHLTFARAWLRCELDDEPPAEYVLDRVRQIRRWRMGDRSCP
jgi:hypothetical protein